MSVFVIKKWVINISLDYGFYLNYFSDDEEVGDEQETVTVSTASQIQSEAHQALTIFWSKVNDEIKKIKVVSKVKFL